MYSYSYITFVRYNTDQYNKGHPLSFKSSWFLRPASSSCGLESWEKKNIFHLSASYKHPFFSTSSCICKWIYAILSYFPVVIFSDVEITADLRKLECNYLIFFNAHFGHLLGILATKVLLQSLHDFFHQGDTLLLSFSTVFLVFIDSTFQHTFSKRRFCLCSANLWFWNSVQVSGYWLLLKPNFSILS